MQVEVRGDGVIAATFASGGINPLTRQRAASHQTTRSVLSVMATCGMYDGAGEWFHTGDGGSLDEQGYLAISDRKKDVIITGGENVSSIEIEDALFSHPDVDEVAVIGIPSDKWGETPKALVVVTPGSVATEADLIAWCRERLAHYKCPSSIEFRDELARTATGKLQKFKLRAPYWEGRDRLVN